MIGLPSLRHDSDNALAEAPKGHRLTSSTVGHPLWEHASGLELIHGFLEALDAYQASWKRHVLHSDIKAESILLAGDPEAVGAVAFFSNVEATSKSRDSAPPKSGSAKSVMKHDGGLEFLGVDAGTVQLMSVDLLEAAFASTCIQCPAERDVESFTLLLGYCVLRRTYKKASAIKRSGDERTFMKAVFMEAFGQLSLGDIMSSRTGGTAFRWCNKKTSGFMEPFFQNRMSDPLQRLLRTLQSYVGQRQIEEDGDEDDGLISVPPLMHDTFGRWVKEAIIQIQDDLSIKDGRASRSRILKSNDVYADGKCGVIAAHDPNLGCYNVLAEGTKAHRLILSTVGRPLRGYRTDLELLEVLVAALDAHEALWKQGILHGDINAESIIIAQDPNAIGAVGFISDDDFAKTPPYVGYSKPEYAMPVMKYDGGLRILGITGTMQFAALQLLLSATIERPLKHTPEHDVESFTWVLGYCVLREVYNKAQAAQEPGDEYSMMKMFFQSAFGHRSLQDLMTSRRAASPLSWCDEDSGFMEPFFQDHISEPLRDLLQDLRSHAAARQISPRRLFGMPGPAPPSTHHTLRQMVRTAVNGLHNDPSRDGIHQITAEQHLPITPSRFLPS